jgi:hypothetical protein
VRGKTHLGFKTPAQTHSILYPYSDVVTTFLWKSIYDESIYDYRTPKRRGQYPIGPIAFTAVVQKSQLRERSVILLIRKLRIPAKFRIVVSRSQQKIPKWTKKRSISGLISFANFNWCKNPSNILKWKVPVIDRVVQLVFRKIGS